MAEASPTSIHQLEADEVQRLKEIRLAGLADAPYAFGSTFAGESAESDQWWLQRATDCHWVVAHRDGQDLAMAMLMYQGLPETFEPIPGARAIDTGVQYPWIRSVWTRPEFRGQGLVDLLLNHLCGVAASAGASTIVLGVRDGNNRAIGSYLRIGFESVGRFWPGNSDLPQPNFLMARTLTS